MCHVCLLAVWEGVHICVCGWVCHECCSRQPAINFSLSWPTLLPAFPQLASSEHIRSNASHSNHFCMITTFSFSCLVSFFNNQDLFCFDIKGAYRIFPQLGFLWGRVRSYFCVTAAESAKANSAFELKVLHKVTAASLYFTGLYGASHLRTSHKRLL